MASARVWPSNSDTGSQLWVYDIYLSHLNNAGRAERFEIHIFKGEISFSFDARARDEKSQKRR